MFWLLVSLLLLVCLVALAFALLTLWRRVKVLGRQVAEAGETAAQASGPLGAAGRPPAGQAQDRPRTGRGA